jgi:Rieske Fe-S protein
MSEDDPKKPKTAASKHVGDDSRRYFLKTLGLGGLGAGLGVVVAGPALFYVAYPLGHTTVSDPQGFLPAGDVSHFKEGVPVKVDLFADKQDAWNRVVQVKVGSAWVVNRGGKLTAFSTVCPHLGCAVDYDGDADKFKCPCHRSTFSIAGAVEGGPAPRSMDELEVTDENGRLAIKYRRFKQGVAEREPV